jgi:hypothetical protein
MLDFLPVATKGSSENLAYGASHAIFQRFPKALTHRDCAMKKIFTRTVCPVLLILTALILISGCFRKENNSRTIAELVEHFNKSGLIIESATPTLPEMILAQDGIFLRIGGSDIQFFKYDTRLKKQKEKLDKIYSNGQITILGVDFPAKINGSFIMLNYKGNPDEAKIVETFESF